MSPASAPARAKSTRRAGGWRAVVWAGNGDDVHEAGAPEAPPHRELHAFAAERDCLGSEVTQVHDLLGRRGLGEGTGEIQRIVVARRELALAPVPVGG
ncbi:MAG: hypothetical protein M0Z63_06810 [Actinomycetota bacterium]|jgi:hypothetical protein|nr:hypothetical protein [Actinomycetota bacterium]